MAEITDEKPEVLTLKSSDGKEFPLSESAAVLSGVFKRMIADGLTEGKIPLESIDGGTLEKIMRYLNKHGDGGVSDEEKKRFDQEFVDVVEMKDLFQLTGVANFLEIKGLMDIVCKEIGNRMKNKSVQWVRRVFNIENDFSPEEEEEMKKEYPWAWEDLDSDGDDD